MGFQIMTIEKALQGAKSEIPLVDSSATQEGEFEIPMSRKHCSEPALWRW
jgi:hypothetical protein